ncbi:hypothetical protein NFI96_001757 [Prochilodus magdalenae]|nr:hypothetical protein NFI96_001757 [Prochilodus magdalenae]
MINTAVGTYPLPNVAIQRDVTMVILAACNLTTKFCDTLYSALQAPNSALKELDLSNNDLEDSGVNMLSDGLKSSHCKLEKLGLSGCIVTDRGCSALASALKSNSSNLRELDLSYNHPGQTGVKLLSDLKSDPHCSLETLRVDYGGEIRMKPGLKKYFCEFILDPNTAHTELSLSDGDRKVTQVLYEPHPDHPGRFDVYGQVLGREKLRSSRDQVRSLEMWVPRNLKLVTCSTAAPLM